MNSGPKGAGRFDIQKGHSLGVMLGAFREERELPVSKAVFPRIGVPIETARTGKHGAFDCGGEVRVVDIVRRVSASVLTKTSAMPCLLLSCGTVSMQGPRCRRS